MFYSEESKQKMWTLLYVVMIQKCYILTFFSNPKLWKNLGFGEFTSFFSLRKKGASP